MLKLRRDLVFGFQEQLRSPTSATSKTLRAKMIVAVQVLTRRTPTCRMKNWNLSTTTALSKKRLSCPTHEQHPLQNLAIDAAVLATLLVVTAITESEEHLDSTALAPATPENDQDAPPGGERQAELEAQLTQLRAEITALQANNQAQR
ncbi:hypothetical protein F442_20598 [Phytophthora nicotianae P10297]|uniref:Uncharacterized protein n=1 Tax=Phytophthora nicotianae P10297 TaxID=1317064 RepID=W2Y5N3_PHYNI|nr:hypothetical protein F442_20598 [Phytophthora nicotianae P10297]